MHFIRMQLNTEKRETLKALMSPNIFHGAIEQSFPGEREKVLWRIDNLNGTRFLMLLSQRKPNMGKLVNQFGYETRSDAWEEADYNQHLQRIISGSKWHFRLVANPAHACHEAHDKNEKWRGPIRAHTSVFYQKRWLMERAERCGFSLNEEEFTVTHTQWYVFKKKGYHRITVLAVAFEGVLTVTEEERFRTLLTEGIGRAKAYGMGLMTVVR